MNMITQTLTKFQSTFPMWDIVMVSDIFLFFLSFVILVSEKSSDVVYSAHAWLWYVNALFVVDLFFRLLSIRITSIKREYWNPILPCIFTICFWLLAAYYGFKNVFGPKPVQGFNIFVFIVYNLGVVLYILYKMFCPKSSETAPEETV